MKHWTNWSGDGWERVGLLVFSTMRIFWMLQSSRTASWIFSIEHILKTRPLMFLMRIPWSHCVNSWRQLVCIILFTSPYLSVYFVLTNITGRKLEENDAQISHTEESIHFYFNQFGNYIKSRYLSKRLKMLVTDLIDLRNVSVISYPSPH